MPETEQTPERRGQIFLSKRSFLLGALKSLFLVGGWIAESKTSLLGKIVGLLSAENSSDNGPFLDLNEYGLGSKDIFTELITDGELNIEAYLRLLLNSGLVECATGQVGSGEMTQPLPISELTAIVEAAILPRKPIDRIVLASNAEDGTSLIRPTALDVSWHYPITTQMLAMPELEQVFARLGFIFNTKIADYLFGLKSCDVVTILNEEESSYWKLQIDFTLLVEVINNKNSSLTIPETHETPFRILFYIDPDTQVPMIEYMIENKLQLGSVAVVEDGFLSLIDNILQKLVPLNLTAGSKVPPIYLARIKEDLSRFKPPRINKTPIDIEADLTSTSTRFNKSRLVFLDLVEKISSLRKPSDFVGKSSLQNQLDYSHLVEQMGSLFTLPISELRSEWIARVVGQPNLSFSSSSMRITVDMLFDFFIKNNLIDNTLLLDGLNWSFGSTEFKQEIPTVLLPDRVTAEVNSLVRTTSSIPDDAQIEIEFATVSSHIFSPTGASSYQMHLTQGLNFQVKVDVQGQEFEYLVIVNRDETAFQLAMNCQLLEVSALAAPYRVDPISLDQQEVLSIIDKVWKEYDSFCNNLS